MKKKMVMISNIYIKMNMNFIILVVQIVHLPMIIKTITTTMIRRFLFEDMMVQIMMLTIGSKEKLFLNMLIIVVHHVQYIFYVMLVDNKCH